MAICVRIRYEDPTLVCLDVQCIDHGFMHQNALLRRRRERARVPRRTLVLQTYGTVCYLCMVGDADIVLTIDHVIPRSRGGSNDISNLRPCCQLCNTWKADRLLSELGGLEAVRLQRMAVRDRLRRRAIRKAKDAR